MKDKKNLTLKNILMDYLNSYGSDDVYYMFREMTLYGYITREVWGTFNDIVAKLFLNEEEGTYTDIDGKVLYRRNDFTGYFDKVTC